MSKRNFSIVIVLFSVLTSTYAPVQNIAPEATAAQTDEPQVSERGVPTPPPPGAGFLKLDGFKGTSTYPGFKDWILFSNMSYGLRQVGTARTGGDEVRLSDITVVKEVDPTSPWIALKCSTAEVIKEGVFVFGANDGYVMLIVNDMVISSITAGFQAGNGRPQETVTFNFQKIKWEYDSKTGIIERTGWDLTKKTKQ